MRTRNFIFAAALTAVSGASFAFDFQTLPTSFPTNPPLATDAIHFCIAAEDLDSALPPLGCKITNGIVTGSDISGSLYALPDGTAAVFPDSPTAPSIVLTELNSTTQDIIVDGTFIGLPAGPVLVGTLTDYVLRDTRDNKLVFAMRAELITSFANQYEINNLFRTGFTGFTAAIGWSRGSDADLRMYNGARTAQKFLSSAPLSYDPDVIRLQSDVNVSEGNARSGYFFIKTDAINYTTASNAISLFQAGEEGQPLNEVFLSGFIPTSPTQVPMLPIWALSLLAFSLCGMAIRIAKVK